MKDISLRSVLNIFAWFTNVFSLPLSEELYLAFLAYKLKAYFQQRLNLLCVFSGFDMEVFRLITEESFSI